MHISSVSPSGLSTKRLDSDFYHPDYLENTDRLSKHPLKELRGCGKFFAGPFGSKLPSSLYISSGIPLFRVSNVGQFEIKEDDLAYLAPSIHQELLASEVISGDLLIVKASVGEKICRVPYSVKKANITQHIIAIRPSGEVDMDYISAFLFSIYGRKQLERYSLGSIIQYLGINDARSVKYLALDATAEKYIGDKIRQAEQLRAWAKKLRQNLASLVTTSAITNAVSTADKKSSWIASADLTPRLDPKYYGCKAMAVLHATADSGVPLRDIVANICNGFEERAYSKNGIRYITVSEVSSGRLDLSSAPKIHSSTEIPGKARINEKCVLVVRTGSIGIAVKVDERDKDAVISSHLIKLEFESEETAVAVATFLNSNAGKVLLHKISYGAVQPQVGQGELLALSMPQHILNKAEELLRLVTVYEDSVRFAKSLVVAAKRLVEVLIEGQLSEQQLVNAQKALETGDHCLDRDILGQLTITGLVDGGDPLFTDLDQLYDLLAQSQQIDVN